MNINYSFNTKYELGQCFKREGCDYCLRIINITISYTNSTPILEYGMVSSDNDEIYPKFYTSNYFEPWSEKSIDDELILINSSEYEKYLA